MSAVQRTKTYLQELFPKVYIPGIMFNDLNLMEQKMAMKLFVLETSDEEFEQIFFDNNCLFFEPNILRLMVNAIDPYQDMDSEKKTINELLENLTKVIFKLLVGSNQNGALGKLFINLRENHELYLIPKRKTQ